jgi:4-amino-4-deoxy-L-arabinose transferase-like glycosyltransferase
MLPSKWYSIFFAVLVIIYIGGLFVPLMNNDAAHHANIALHMHLTGDYVNLIDQGHDYLDKPHLHFWLSAFSYKVFGVNSFAYKFPSFLFTLLGIYATFRLGRSLYDTETGKLAALVLGTAYAFVLAVNDVRMDAILTAAMIFSTWQLYNWVTGKKIINFFGSAIGLAIGFSTKGMIGAVMPLMSIFFYCLFGKQWKTLFDWRWVLMGLVTFLFLSPVLYCYYLQFDLHPEKVIRGRSGISGIQFILWSQNFERLGGESFGNAAENDRLFFVHTYLWAFLPWSIAGLLALVRSIVLFFRFRFSFSSMGESLITPTFIVMFFILSSSGFKLPHYLNILFPLLSILTAHEILKVTKVGDGKFLVIAQFIVSMLMLLTVIILNAFIFPITNILVLLCTILFVTGYVWFRKQTRNSYQNAILFTLVVALLSNMLFNFNFYPQMLQYQAGNVLASIAKEQQIPIENISYLEGAEHSNSFDFYTARLTPFVTVDPVRNVDGFIYTGENGLKILNDQKIPYHIVATASDYRVSKLSGTFLNPKKRYQKLKNHYLLRLGKS